MNVLNDKKNCLVVGANGAMAVETIKHLLNAEEAHITMACRTESNGMQAKEKIIAEKGKAIASRLTVVGGFDMC